MLKRKLALPPDSSRSVDCKTCKQTLAADNFYWSSAGYRHSRDCKACYQLSRRAYQNAYRQKNKDQINQKKRKTYCPEKRSVSILASYNLSVLDYEQLLEAQGGGCAICGTTDPKTPKNGRFCVDHDHGSGEVRGLLCAPCNRGIGLLGDSSDILEKGAKYLKNPPAQRKWDC